MNHDLHNAGLHGLEKVIIKSWYFVIIEAAQTSNGPMK
jgi:hypothetical protein